MEFITNNYLIIIIIAAFLMFALIGFIVDTEKNKKRKEENGNEISESEQPALVENEHSTETVNVIPNIEGNIPIIEEAEPNDK